MTPPPTTAALPRPLPLALLLGLATAVALASAADGGLFYVSIILLGLTVASLVLARPVFGLVLMIVAFLFVYSKWIPMVRPFTPNVALGFLLALAALLNLFRERDFWFLRSPPVLLLAAIGIGYTVSTRSARPTCPVSPRGTSSGRSRPTWRSC